MPDTLVRTCAEPDCTEPATHGPGHTIRFCAAHFEDRELEYDLTLDASSYGHTDVVQQLAEQAAHAALVGFENGEHGDLLLNASRAALLATTAALRALEDAGHLVPEGATVTKRWQAFSDHGLQLTLPMDADEFEHWMKARGLLADEHIVTLRTIATPIPREATKPQPLAEPAVPAEVDF